MASPSLLNCTLGGNEIKIEIEEVNGDPLELGEDVVPTVVITVKTKVKELTDKVSAIKSILVSTDLKWEELLSLYKIRLNPTLYCISCSRGYMFNLGSKVQEYTRKVSSNYHVVQLKRIKTQTELFEATPTENKDNTVSMPVTRGSTPTPYDLDSATTRDEINGGDIDPKQKKQKERTKKVSHQCKYCKSWHTSSKTRWTCESRCWGLKNPHICKYCNFPFIYKSSMKRHLEKLNKCSKKAKRERKYSYKVGDYFAKYICGFRVTDGIQFFLVRWHNRELETWEPIQALDVCKPLIEKFRSDLKKNKGSTN